MCSKGQGMGAEERNIGMEVAPAPGRDCTPPAPRVCNMVLPEQPHRISEALRPSPAMPPLPTANPSAKLQNGALLKFTHETSASCSPVKNPETKTLSWSGGFLWSVDKPRPSSQPDGCFQQGLPSTPQPADTRRGQMDPEPWNSLVTAHTSPGSQLRPCDVRVASWPPHGLKMGGHSERVLSTVYPALPALSISGAGRQAHLVLCPHLTAFPGAWRVNGVFRRNLSACFT